MRVLLIGRSGQLGRTLYQRLSAGGIEVYAPPSSELDVARQANIIHYIEHTSPHYVINCAGMHDANRCEELPQQALNINSNGPRWIAQCCVKEGIWFLHFSTDQVLSGQGILENEEAPTFWYDTYSRTKREGEFSIRTLSGDFCVIRVSALFGHYPCTGKPRPNFVQQVLTAQREGREMSLPNNIGCSPGYCEDIGDVIDNMIRNVVPLPKVLHLCPSGLTGQYSWYDFARDIVEVSGGDPSLLGSREETRASTGLVNLTTSYSFAKLPSVRDALRRYLARENI